METFRVNISSEDVNHWNALKLYYEQPKCINREVLFSESVFSAELPSSANEIEFRTLVDDLSCKLLGDGRFEYDINVSERLDLNIIENKNVETVFESTKGIFLLLRKLIPKRHGSFNFYEFIFLDKSLSKVCIFTKSIPDKTLEDLSLDENKQDPYVILKFNFIQLNWSEDFLVISFDKNLSEKGINWLKAVFIPKFTKLSISICENLNKKTNKLEFESKIDIVQYYKLYEMMKLKYGKYFVERWTENTDPKKFVYEDIAIATYLLMLWNNGKIPGENVKKQKFVDLGCGNGLLVHILNSEGHSGIGLDIRKRKIWDLYPSSTVLKEETIKPSVDNIYPDADWLIGNHSDELTAWIPIMARLSNKNCQYFLLPCCPYQLNGMKYQRKNTSLSSYQDFISYLKSVSSVCGFVTSIDRLRIPSTKRICLIGINNCEMSKSDYNSFVESAIGFVNQETLSLMFQKEENYAKSEEQCFNTVKLRKSVEEVRNCTKLSQELINDILKAVLSELLKENINYTIMRNGGSCTWNRGGKIPIRKLVSCLDENLLKQLKNECKGLQTLLKNHHFIFEVSQGQVQLRNPESMLEICNKFTKSDKWKRKICWFFKNHPDQCPLSNDVCSYSHEI